jgi:hypothetical protein
VLTVDAQFGLFFGGRRDQVPTLLGEALPFISLLRLLSDLGIDQLGLLAFKADPLKVAVVLSVLATWLADETVIAAVLGFDLPLASLDLSDSIVGLAGALANLEIARELVDPGPML